MNSIYFCVKNEGEVYNRIWVLLSVWFKVFFKKFFLVGYGLKLIKVLYLREIEECIVSYWLRFVSNLFLKVFDFFIMYNL